MGKYCETKDRLIIVRLGSDLDHHITEMVRTEIDELLELSRDYSIAFDFRKVGFMDSSGIGLIMGRYKKVNNMGRYIYVSNLNISLQRIFKLSGLYSITIRSREIDQLVNREATYAEN